MGEPFEVVPAPRIMNSFSEVESVGQVYMHKSCLQGGYEWVGGEGYMDKGWH